MKFLYGISFVFLSGIAFGGGVLFFLLHDAAPLIENIAHNSYPAPIIVMDDCGNELWRFHQQKHHYLAFNQIPQHLIQAFIAAEDHDFFKHPGISLRGIVRSLIVNSIHRRAVQGASTITQQLVKLRLVGSQKTFMRKIKEQIIALIIEYHLSKEQILEAYLNTVCFGCGIYGIQAASHFFWHTSSDQLSIAQAATLAGTVRMPSRYCPLLHKDSAEKRRNTVLHSMLGCGFISSEEYVHSTQEPLVLAEVATNAPHFGQLVRAYIEEHYGLAAYAQGLVVHTTLNSSMQKQAEKVFQERVQELRGKLSLPLDGALLCLESETGAVKALVGGYDFSTSSFDRSRQAYRQMGSIIKPFLYAAYVEQGGSLDDTQVDEPLSFQIGNTVWQPRNFNHAFKGSMSCSYALSASNNIVAIKTLLAMGYQPLQDLLRSLHIERPLHDYPSLALGCIDVSLWQATSMFTIFAHRGKYCAPYFISCIKDMQGQKLEKHHQQDEPIISWQTSTAIGQVLTSVYERLSNRLQKKLPCQAFGKTGTTNDARSIWFVGSTPTYTTGIFLGCDDYKALGNEIYASLTAFPLWLDFNAVIEQPANDFVWSPDIRYNSFDF